MRYEFARGSLEAKAWRLLYAKHVHGVTEIKEQGKPNMIFGYCIREMSVAKTSYFVELTLDNLRNVVDSHCNCRSGSTGQCKHTGAVALYVNSERNESQTDQTCVWNKPSNKGRSLYPKGETIDAIIGNPNPIAKRSHLGPNEVQKATMISNMREVGLEASLLFQVLTCPQDQEDSKREEENVSEEDLPPWVGGVFVDPIPSNQGLVATQIGNIVTVRTLIGNLTPEVLDFYLSNVKVSEEGCNVICRITQSQRGCSTWFIERESRITASMAYKIANGKTEETRLKYFSTKPPSSLKALQYGRDLEETARKAFEQETGLRVTKVGLCIKPNEPWLACSPDGLIQEPDRSIALLELKCPVSCERGPIQVEYLQNNHLKKQHPYFGQIQVSLYVLNLTKCFLFVFSEADSKLITIERDDEWL